MIGAAPWRWFAFILFVLFCLAVDMGAFNRRAGAVTVREALRWSGLWLALAIIFAGLLAFLRDREEAMEFATGYLLELSLSLDNVLAIALVFAAFQVPPASQPRVLVCGLVGALLMRGVMIGVGAALVQRFEALFYVLGVFLIIAGLRVLVARSRQIQPQENRVVRMARKCFPVAPALDGQKFVTRINGRLVLTPLMLVLLLVETTDLIFAADSIPAVFAVTQKAFIVFTSNVFAMLGLRSLYFVFAGALGKFRHLKAGLALILVFVGSKMLLDPHGHPPRWFQIHISAVVSLLVVIIIAAGAIGLSLRGRGRGKVEASKR